MKHPDLHSFVRRLYRKLKRKLIVRLFGYCHYHGHNWKMKKGWQNNPKWSPEESQRLTGNAFVGMTKPWVYYECKRCGAKGE
jgi:hypothetical protein